ncbi:succinylglutamate desuccinylase/aspartoacylase family protein [Halalkalicoccus jeotgali]|uniref:Succinylglutamate desuccinylase / aspartoacylase family protein n=1 Tax=Halalkalicoccus jeotgali (strain DSM 18796 / CECT 7217 / JCM 14584 / KCTC 4019 / B3) TaxID=795797 RepID=D8J800_HALJB|nr:succinylglutamate desuccinylase/aspartoacylase family protein [Halalkalicoccus jeotgali]ADJ14113.1 succinylglutamate desuccinylase / aspartoacylase family protein [Halalkalicoccus jeotgali B3]ELY34705.1 succinylglutamate desuccinylase / aspartoacylase family protein [Halalkalicoccus jeotgali B3]
MVTHDAERLTLARLPSGIEIETTIHRYRGGRSGPKIYVQAAQHGREVNGVEVLRRLHDRLVSAELAGEVIAVPVADPLTFDRVSYTTPEALDSINANMNRAWPGSSDGTLHERMTAALWERAREADAVVDLHTGSPEMLTHVVFMAGDDGSRALAEAFGTDLLLAERAGEAANEEWSQRGFDGKLRVAATRAGIPTITPELASNKRIDESAVEAGLEGTLNVLRDRSVLSGAPEPRGERRLARNHLGRVTATDSGLFRAESTLEVGREIEAGTYLGTLYDPTTYEVLQEARADRDGILYALTKEATVTAGGKLANVALPLDNEDD